MYVVNRESLNVVSPVTSKPADFKIMMTGNGEFCADYLLSKDDVKSKETTRKPFVV